MAGFLSVVSSDRKPTKSVVVSSASDFPATLDSTVQYLIDGHVDMGTRSLEVPVGGLSVVGLGVDISSLYSAQGAYAIFTTPAVGGCGSLYVSGMTLSATGSGSEVMALLAEGVNKGLEFDRVRFLNCSSLGFVGQFTQGVETNTIRLGGSPSLRFFGGWAAGYRLSSSIVRGLSGTMTQPLFREGVAFTMQSRFKADINCDLPALAPLTDFSPTNFPNPSTLQFDSAIITRDGVSNPEDSNLTPNVSRGDLCSRWVRNTGLANTFVGGTQTSVSAATTVISAINVPSTLAGTYVPTGMEHFDAPSNGELRHLGDNPREFCVEFSLVIEGKPNDNYEIRLQKVAADTTETTEFSQIRTINNLQGGRDVGYYVGVANVILNRNDKVYWQVVNLLDDDNCILEAGSSWSVEER